MPKSRRFPVVSVGVRGGSVRLSWSYKRRMFRISLGGDVDQRATLRLAAEINLALAGGEWPGWALSHPAVQRYRAEIEDVGAVGSGGLIIGDGEILALYRKHLFANRTARSAAEMLARVVELARWSAVPLVALTRPDLMDWLDWIRSTPAISTRAWQVLDQVRQGETIQARELCDRMVAAGWAKATQKDYERIRRVLRERPDLFDRVGRGVYRRRSKAALGPGRAVTTRNKALSQGLVFGRWMVSRGFWDQNIFEGLGFPKGDRPDEIVYCTDDERDQVLAVADGLGFGPQVRLALFEGLRRGEIAALRPGDVFLDRGVLSIGRHRESKTKTGKARVVPIFDSARPTIVELMQRKRGRLIAWPERFQDVADGETDRIKAALTEAERPELVARVGYNVWRHTFCTNLAATGKITIDQLAAISGHTPRVCRDHYAHLCPDMVIDSLAGLL